VHSGRHEIRSRGTNRFPPTTSVRIASSSMRYGTLIASQIIFRRFHVGGTIFSSSLMRDGGIRDEREEGEEERRVLSHFL